MKNGFVGLHWDFLGFGSSMLCAVHCALLPIFVSLAPLAGLQFMHNHWLEYAIIGLSLTIASYAFVHGYRRHHQKLLPMVLVFIGFISIGAGHLYQNLWGEVILTTCGGIGIAIAHFINWKMIKQSTHDIIGIKK